MCRLEYVSDSESGDVPAFFPVLTILEGLMSCRKQGTLPEPRLRKCGHLRLRVNVREFVLSQPGSRQTDEDTNPFWRRGVLVVAGSQTISNGN